MHKGKWKARLQRVGWSGGVVVVIVAIVAIVFSPDSLRGPEAVARNFIEALLRVPEDSARLRAAGHLGEADDPETLIEGLSTRIAIDFLRARARQGAAHNVGVFDTQRSDARQYSAVLQVLDSTDGRSAGGRRFQVRLQQTDDGKWRVVTVALVE